jgi:hypothetical protein
MLNRYKVACVEWVDITGRGELGSIREVLEAKPAVFHTLGFILADTGDILRIASDISLMSGPDGTCFRDIVLIPKVVIRKIEYLEVCRG